MKWEVKKLGEVCELITRGIAPKYTDAGGICVINQKCIRDHDINYQLSRRHNIDKKSVPEERLIRVGDVLINSTGTGTLGRVAQVREEPKEKTTVDTHVTIARPITGKFHLDFFGYMLIKIEDEIAKSGEGASGQTELSRKKVADYFNVHFPHSLEEQKRIVGILDESFKVIALAEANTKKNLANARELFDSYLNKIFTEKGDNWIETSLNKLCNIKHGFAFKSEFFTNEENEYILLTPGSFYETGGFRDQGQKTKYYIGEIPDSYILNKDDFLIAMTEQAVGLLGSSLLVPEDNKFLHNQRLGLVEKFQDVKWDNNFFFHQLNTRAFRNAVQSSASGVKVRHTSPTKLGVITVSFPNSIEEQKNIAIKLDKVKEEKQKLEAIYQRKLEALAELKQSILQKAFTGQLTQ